jgi:hypothetical protein
MITQTLAGAVYPGLGSVKDGMLNMGGQALSYHLPPAAFPRVVLVTSFDRLKTGRTGGRPPIRTLIPGFLFAVGMVRTGVNLNGEVNKAQAVRHQIPIRGRRSGLLVITAISTTITTAVMTMTIRVFLSPSAGWSCPKM